MWRISMVTATSITRCSTPVRARAAIWYLSGVTLITGLYGPTLPSGWRLVRPATSTGTASRIICFTTRARANAIWFMNDNASLSAASTVDSAIVEHRRVWPTSTATANVITYSLTQAHASAIWYLTGVTFLCQLYGRLRQLAGALLVRPTSTGTASRTFFSVKHSLASDLAS